MPYILLPSGTSKVTKKTMVASRIAQNNRRDDFSHAFINLYIPHLVPTMI